MGIGHEAVKNFLLHRKLKRLLVKENKGSGIQYLEKLEFRKGMVTDDIFDSFGKLIDVTEELSSDTYQKE